MTPRETDEWNMRVNKPLIAWSVEKPGTLLVREPTLWGVLALFAFMLIAPFALAFAVRALLL